MQAVAVIGPESSGSVFIARVISHVIGGCSRFGEWSGYGFSKDLGKDKLVLHRSVPWMRPKRFHARLSELDELFQAYDDLKYVLTARDPLISCLSKIERFGGDLEEARSDLQRGYPLFAELLNDPRCFLWSYETMCLFGAAYFQQLYRFLGVESGFLPEVNNANAKYIGNN